VNTDHDSEAENSLGPQIFCKACSSPLVQATDWAEEEGGWRARIWCPECGFEQEVVLAKAEVAYLSLAVESGFAYLLEALAELEDMPNGGFAHFDPVARMRTERLARASL
jgi:hypothetical protein